MFADNGLQSIAASRPLGLRADTPVDESVLRMASRLELYDLSFVEERLTEKQVMSKADCEAAAIELKRFFLLVGLKVGPLAMIGPAVDDVWHQLVLFTPQYRRFCANTVGFFADHLPDTSTTPVPRHAGETFLATYERFFGALPPIWWKGMDKATVMHYSCRPVQGPPEARWSGWTGNVSDE